MPEGDISLFDALSTQRAIRSYKHEPVPRDVLAKIIEYATKAPSGGNSQPWAFIVVDDREKIRALGDIARVQFAAMYENAMKNVQPGDPPPLPRLKLMVEDFDNIPAIVYPCLVKPERNPTGAGMHSSIYPAVQNLLLAARGFGVGAAFTTMTLNDLPKVREILSLPENIEPLVMVPMGYPDKERYGKTTRRPWQEVTHFNSWEGDKGNSSVPTHRMSHGPTS
ncbi:MAG: nitroreductase family protein [Dehalococcoidia bacterium]